jgi:hypothetical protein
MKGDFYTPSIWVDEAHKMISQQLGVDWKQEYMVWDSASGTKNLTRDYKFFELYSSSIDASDLKISEEYNKEGIAFQYDFLNDDVELFDDLLKRVKNGEFLTVNDFKDSKIYKYAPSLIQGLLNGRKLLFLINPPYATATNRDETSKDGVSETVVNKIMLRDKIGASSQQLYSQFLYRIKMIKNLFGINVAIGLFSPTNWLSGSMSMELRKSLSKDLGYIDGMLFQASNFADVQDNWGIAFSIFKSSSQNFSKFSYQLKDLKDGGVVSFGNKEVYNLDNTKSLSDWIREEVKNVKTFDAPQMKGAITWNNKKNRGRLIKDAMGYLVVGGNNIHQSNQMVIFLSSCYNTANGVSVTSENFNKLISAFTARRLITGQHSNWMNWQDEFMIPNTKHEQYKQWENDAIIYSLFNGKSNQSSLRDINYNGKNWDILNHFFFMSEQEMKDLAQGKQDRATINNDIEKDILNHGGDRFVYEQIKAIEAVNGFSDDAQALLDKARELVAKSFKYRKLFAQTHPQYQIETWDAGWYQVKAILKEYMKDELDEFNKMYKEFENRMRPLVYELGFLYE